MAEPIVHVIDDDAPFRASLSFLLESAGFTVRAYDSALAFLQEYPTAERGVIVTDVRMPEINGVQLVHRLKSQGASDPVIVITGHADVPLAVEAMKAGVDDFIEKPFSDEVLLSAIQSALARSADSDRYRHEREVIAGRLAGLSARERQVLDALVAGHANKVIAYDLGISARTVEVYRANVMTKMRAASLSELVRMALLGEASPTRVFDGDQGAASRPRE